MDDIFQALFALAIILLGLFGSGRKKKRTQGQRRPPATRRPGGPGSRAPSKPPIDLTDIERILTGGAPKADAPPAPAPTPASPVEARAPAEPAVRAPASAPKEEPAWQAGLARRARTVETLDRAGEASHDRFHEQYVDPAATPPATVEREPGPVAIQDLRRMIVWREILGPPAGLR